MSDGKLCFKNGFEYIILDTVYKSNINKTAFYKATEKYTGRTVGIKLIQAPPNLLNEYIKEIRVLMKLESYAKNIPTVYQYYINGNSLFIIMQYIEGKSLTKLMENAKESILTKDTTYITLKRLKKLAGVLKQIHHRENGQSAYIQHKDLKPDNIIIKGHYPNEEVYLIDFGLSASTIAKGTKGYQSPEQSDMFSYTSDGTRIDVFTFGLIMYELLCGQKISFGEHLILDTENNKWKNIPKISDINKNVSTQIDEIFKKCIAFNPQERFNNGGEIECQLRKIIK